VQVGLTGSIGAGKTTVAQLLREHGAHVIDADAHARAVLDEPEAQGALIETFGPDVMRDGHVDRGALAERVFQDPAQRAALEAIVHPRVRQRVADEIAAALAKPEPPAMIVHDVPLLYETGLAGTMDAVLVVDAPLPLRIERVEARTGLSETEIRRRDAAQWPAARKRTEADVVIVNDGDLDTLRTRLEAAWPTLLELARTRATQR